VLLPGQFVRLHFVGLKRPDAILVPQRAVQRGLAGAFVYVLVDSKPGSGAGRRGDVLGDGHG